jgi:hypothetical protein
MILAFENLNGFEKDILVAAEPYIDFIYSFNEKMYYWQRHHFFVDGKSVFKLRLHKANNLRQGLICTNFEEAKALSMCIDEINLDSKLFKENLWLENYIKQNKNNSFLKNIALPVSEYISHYSKDFKMLKLIDFEELFSLKNI